jgi:hypothetical protein
MRGMWLSFLVLSCAACDVVESEDLETSEIEAKIEVNGKPDGAQVVAVLTRDGSLNDRVELNDGDRLVARVGKQEVVLAQDDEILNALRYVGRLPDVGPGTIVRVSLERAAADDAEATASLPDPFELVAPTRNATLDLSAPVTVTWSGGAAGTEMLIDYSVNCAQASHAGGSTEQDTGRAKIEIELERDGSARESCPGELKLTRRKQGELRGPWTGTIEGQQVRSVDVRME